MKLWFSNNDIMEEEGIHPGVFTENTMLRNNDTGLQMIIPLGDYCGVVECNTEPFDFETHEKRVRKSRKKVRPYRYCDSSIKLLRERADIVGQVDCIQSPYDPQYYFYASKKITAIIHTHDDAATVLCFPSSVSAPKQLTCEDKATNLERFICKCAVCACEDYPHFEKPQDKHFSQPSVKISSSPQSGQGVVAML